MATGPSSRGRPWFRSRSGVVLLGFLAIAAFFLIAEHTAHVPGALPYVLLLPRAAPAEARAHSSSTRPFPMPDLMKSERRMVLFLKNDAA